MILIISKNIIYIYTYSSHSFANAYKNNISDRECIIEKQLNLQNQKMFQMHNIMVQSIHMHAKYLCI